MKKNQLLYFTELVVISCLIVVCAQLCSRTTHRYIESLTEKHNLSLKHEIMLCIGVIIVSIIIAYFLNKKCHSDDKDDETSNNVAYYGAYNANAESRLTQFSQI